MKKAHELLLEKARKYQNFAVNLKVQGDFQESNEYFIRAASFREAAKIVENVEKDNV